MYMYMCHERGFGGLGCVGACADVRSRMPTHADVCEYLTVATKGGALSGLGGLGSVGAGGWSYMSDDMAPKDAQEVTIS